MSRMRLPILLSLTASTAALATPEPPTDMNLFGDGIVRKISVGQILPNGARDGRELTAHSATVGDLHLPPEAVSELIFHPPSPQDQHTSRPAE